MFPVNGWRAFCSVGAMVVVLLSMFVFNGPSVLSTVLYSAFLILMPAHKTRDSKLLTIFCISAALLLAAANATTITLRAQGMYP